MEAFKQFLKSICKITDIEFLDSLDYFKVQYLKKNTFFAKEGEVCKQIGFVLSGTLRTYYMSDKGEETTACFCTENHFTTAYKSFILQEISNLSIQALEDVHLLVIDHHHLQKLYFEIPIWQNIGRIIIEQEYIVMERYASFLNNETAKEKYIRLLNEQPNVIEKANLQDIASYLGVTRRTLSRIRKEINS